MRRAGNDRQRPRSERDSISDHLTKVSRVCVSSPVIMDGILDFSKDLDIGLLDNVVAAMYTGTGNDQKMAQQALAQFQEHPDAWQRVPAILQQSSSAHTKVSGDRNPSLKASNKYC